MIGLDLLGAGFSGGAVTTRGPALTFHPIAPIRTILRSRTAPLIVPQIVPAVLPIAPLSDSSGNPGIDATDGGYQPDDPMPTDGYDPPENDDAPDEEPADDTPEEVNRMLGLDVLVGSAADPKVKAVQAALKAAGFDIGKSGADGKMGSDTEKAITAFWDSKGESHVAVIDDDLLRALGVASTAASPAPAANAPRSATGASTGGGAADDADAAAAQRKKLFIIGGGAAALLIGALIFVVGGKK